MSDPRGYTYGELCIRVAEYLGVARYASADAAPTLPTSAHDLDLVQRMVNDGFRVLVAEKPNWEWMKRIVTLAIGPTAPGQVGGLADTYYMPEDFNGDSGGEWVYGRGEDVYPSISVVPEAELRRMVSISDDDAGEPFLAAFRRLNEGDAPAGSNRRWQVQFWPAPGESYMVTYQYRAYVFPMTDTDNDYSPAGPEFDQVVLASCLARAELHRHDTRGAHFEEYQRELAKALAIDARSGPTFIGRRAERAGDMRDEFHDSNMRLSGATTYT